MSCEYLGGISRAEKLHEINTKKHHEKHGMQVSNQQETEVKD